MVSASIHTQLAKALGTTDYKVKSVGGGCINQTYCVETPQQKFFCKLNSSRDFPQMFVKEKNGLHLIAKQGVIKTPRVIDCTEIDDEQLLVLEWIETGVKSSLFWRRFGEQLAKLHYVSNGYFGLGENNYMGSVVQLNTEERDWISFFIQHRLQALVNKCIASLLLTSKHEQQLQTLYKKISQIFPIEEPSLLHGDLWSGNYMCDENSNPVLIDTAVYFGHRSIDLGMTTLFGGFDREFYESYHYHFPLPKNYKEQWEVCNLYPLLIHLRLFGKSYLSQIETTLKSYQ